MKIGIVDADFIGRKNHNFPNLACMKISGYFKSRGDNVQLLTNYDNFPRFDKVFVAKVFSDTPIPNDGLFGSVLNQPNVTCGGTGFFFDNAPPLPADIEHSMPDYQLYQDVAQGKFFTDFSIGFLTRGCFRHCSFCVNRRADKVLKHSPLEEFLDHGRPKICLLDDNFFGYENWKFELEKLIATGKFFTFKQGLDVRLLDEAKAQLLFNARYDGDFIFAFDHWIDAPLIEDKLKLIRSFTRKRVKFYVLCGFDRRGYYDEDFWRRDLQETFLRIRLLMKYDALPFVMKHRNYLRSPFRQIYSKIARWCNQVHIFWKMSFADFCKVENFTPRLDFLDAHFLNLKFGQKNL